MKRLTDSQLGDITLIMNWKKSDLEVMIKNKEIKEELLEYERKTIKKIDDILETIEQIRIEERVASM